MRRKAAEPGQQGEYGPDPESSTGKSRSRDVVLTWDFPPLRLRSFCVATDSLIHNERLLKVTRKGGKSFARQWQRGSRDRGNSLSLSLPPSCLYWQDQQHGWAGEGWAEIVAPLRFSARRSAGGGPGPDGAYYPSSPGWSGRWSKCWSNTGG